MIKIIADSTAYVTKEYAEKNDITIIPLRYLVNEKEYEEGWPGTYGEFFDDFLKNKVFPKTSQPSPALFIQEYNKAIAKGDDVLVFTIGSTFSGTFNVATLAKNQCDAPEKVTVFDSQGLAETIFGYIMEAVNWRNEGKSVSEIVEHLNKDCLDKSSIIFVPETMQYLEKGGRIGKVTATIGSILQIKPIIICNKNELTNKKSFGLQKAIKDMFAMIPEKINRLFILYLARAETFGKFKEMIYKLLGSRKDKDKIEIYEGEVGPVVGTYAGPAIGLAWTAQG